jgi:protein-disulfide isomerase
MDNRNTILVGLSFLAIGLMAGLLLSDGGLEPSADNYADSNNQGQELEFISVSEDDDAFLGAEDAPVVIVEFSDYQCPYCAKFQSETLPLLKENYIDQGLVKLIYRDFPIPSHTDAMTAAIAAECVADQGGNEAYYEMHDVIFENMAAWSYVEGAEDILLGYASDLGYDIASCMDDPAMAEEVDADYVAGRSYGVSGTPTFFINGKKLVGAYPYEVFAQLIDAEL